MDKPASTRPSPAFARRWLRPAARADRRPARLGAHRGTSRRRARLRGRRDREQPDLRRRRYPDPRVDERGTPGGHREGGAHIGVAKLHRATPDSFVSTPVTSSVASHRWATRSRSRLAGSRPAALPRDLGSRRAPRRRLQHQLRRTAHLDRRSRGRRQRRLTGPTPAADQDPPHDRRLEERLRPLDEAGHQQELPGQHRVGAAARVNRSRYRFMNFMSGVRLPSTSS